MVIGDETDLGTELGMLLLREATKTRVCLLKGGIDAAKVECPQLLRKGSANQSVKGMVAHYERFIQKSQAA